MTSRSTRRRRSMERKESYRQFEQRRKARTGCASTVLAPEFDGLDMEMLGA